MNTRYNRHRISQKAMQDAMHTTQGETTPLSGPDVGTVCYTIFGKHDESVNGLPVLWDVEDAEGCIWPAEDREEAYAKRVNTQTSIIYYIRTGHDGRLFNPLSGQNESLHNKQKLGLGGRTFLRVAPNTFDMYLSFLKTKNQSWLNNAERENM
jgi:hypothetical protein